MAKWGTILGAFDIKYLPRTTINGRIMAELVAEFTEMLSDSKEGAKPEEAVIVGSVEIQQVWHLFVDGVANQKGSGIGIVMISSDGITLEKSLRLGFVVTNNEAEYEALLVGLAAMRKLGGKVVRAYYDSRVIVREVRVPRSKNSHANLLATLATTSRENLPRIILMEDYTLPTYDVPVPVGVHFTQMSTSWMDPLSTLLKSGLLPKDKIEAEKICRKVSRFWLLED
ncbi:uncharacterized protein LOC142635048 [Castanea sativa]|uniref:uncharacterized protein LOC142635048 n=1 Tax=Castanea sativa TaxID=21020 RepID=UPI003F64C658